MTEEVPFQPPYYDDSVGRFRDPLTGRFASTFVGLEYSTWGFERGVFRMRDYYGTSLPGIGELMPKSFRIDYVNISREFRLTRANVYEAAPGEGRYYATIVTFRKPDGGMGVIRMAHRGNTPIDVNVEDFRIRSMIGNALKLEGKAKYDENLRSLVLHIEHYVAL